MCMLGTVVNMIQHHVFNGHAALVSIGFLQVTAHASQESFDIVLFVDRHNFVTDGVVWRVKGDGQRNVNHIAQFVQRRHHAGSRERNAALGQTKTEIVEHNFHRRNDVGQVEQRFTHPHHHHVGDWTCTGDFRCTHDFRSTPDLADNFRYAQVTVKALLRRRAEFALQRTAHLRRDAQRGAIVFRDIHGFNTLIANGNGPLDSAI